MKTTTKTTAQLQALQLKAQTLVQTLNEQLITVTKGEQHVNVKPGNAYKLSVKDGDVLSENFNVIAIKTGNDLEVLLPNDASVVFDGYFEVCATDLSCLVSLPGKNGNYYVTEGNFATLADGSQVVHFYGDESTLSSITSSQSSLFSQSFSEVYLAKGFTTTGVVGGLLAVGAVAAGGTSSDTSAGAGGASVSGRFSAGEYATDSTGGAVKVYSADGNNTLLGEGTLNSDGEFSITLDTSYTGAVYIHLAKAGVKHKDEAAGTKDLSSDLFAIAVLNAGLNEVEINVQTTIAAEVAGIITSTDTDTTVVTDKILTADRINTLNELTAKALGLTGNVITNKVDILNSQADDTDGNEVSGQIAAAISGMREKFADKTFTFSAIVKQLAASIEAVGALSTADIEALKAGAKEVEVKAANDLVLATGAAADAQSRYDDAFALDPDSADTASKRTILNAKEAEKLAAEATEKATSGLEGLFAAGEFFANLAAPSLTITDDMAGTVTKGGMVTYTFTFSEDVTGFEADDISVANGTKGTFTPSSASIYTLVVTPTDDSTDAITVDVAKLVATATDATGYGNTAAARSVQPVDTEALSLTITDSVPDGDTVIKDGMVTYTFTFSEGVTDFDETDITVGNGTKGAFIRTDASVYTLVVTPDADSTEDITVDVAASAATDAAGNANTMATSVQAVDTAVPTLSSVAISATDGSDVAKTTTLDTGDKIIVVVTMSEPTAVTGTPTYNINVGSAIKAASYVSGDGTNSLTFSYTVAHGDTDASGGITASTSALSLASGTTLKDGAGNDAVPTTPVVDANTIVVNATTTDSIAPTITSIGFSSDAGSDDTYKIGDQVMVTLSMSEATTVDTSGGTPSIALIIGTATKAATYASGSHTNSLTFSYTIVDGDTDTDGISIAENTITLNGGVLKDAADNTANTDHNAVDASNSHKVEATAPSLTITDDMRDTVAKGETVTYTFAFSEDVTGFEATDIAVDHGTKGTFTSSSASIYTLVVTPDADSTENITVDVAASAATDAAGNGNTMATQSVQPVDTAAPSLTITDSVPDGDTVIKDGMVTYTFTFSEGVTDFDETDITVDNGTKGDFTSTNASVYTLVVTPDADSTEDITVDVAASAATDTAGNNNTAAQSAQTVDTAAPTLSSVAISATDDSDTPKTTPLDTGDKIIVTVTMSEVTIVIGAPTYSIDVGGAIKTASYVPAGSDSNSLKFSYIVVSGDTDSSGGITASTSALSLASGTTLKDAAGNDAVLTAPVVDVNTIAVSATTVADTTKPTVDTVAFNSAGNDGTYKAGDQVVVTLSMSEATIVDTLGGIPSIALIVGTATKAATYASGSTTSSLTFSYTIADGDTDADGISIAENTITLNGGVLKDAADNTANTDHAAVTTSSSHKVDTTEPTVTGVAFNSAGSDGAYKIGDLVEVTLSMSEVTKVDGTPRIALRVGTEIKHATYTSGSNTNSLKFGYTIVDGDTDTDGIAILANTIDLNGGTLKDAAGNAADTDHNAVTTSNLHKVDGTAPSLTITDSEPSTVAKGETVTYTFTFNEDVTGFAVNDIDVTNGTKGTFTSTSASVYTLVVTPKDDSTDAITVNVAASAATDVAGNNTVAVESAQAVDTKAPGLHGTILPSTALTDGGNTAGDTIVLTITFDGNVSGLISGNIDGIFKLEGAAASATWSGINGSATRTLTYTVVAGQNGAATIDEAALKVALEGGITDAVGNEFAHTGVIADIDVTALPIVDTTAPTQASGENVVVSDVDGDSAYNSGDTITFKFSEAVQDIDLNAFSLGTGTLNLGVGATATANGNDVTLTLGDVGLNLVAGSVFKLNKNAVLDTAGNALDNSGTIDTTIPGFKPVAQSAIAGAANIDVRTNIILKFAGEVAVNTGNIVLVDNNVGIEDALDADGDGNTAEQVDGYGWYDDVLKNDQTLAVGEATASYDASTKITTVTIDPGRDLDFATNYKLRIDAGAFKFAGTTVLSEASEMTFSTVTPAINTNGQLSKIMDTTGELVDSYYWFSNNNQGVFISGAIPVALDFGTKRAALATAVGSDKNGLSSPGNSRGFVELVGFTNDDLIYKDNSNAGETQAEAELSSLEGGNNDWSNDNALGIGNAWLLLDGYTDIQNNNMLEFALDNAQTATELANVRYISSDPNIIIG